MKRTIALVAVFLVSGLLCSSNEPRSVAIAQSRPLYLEITFQSWMDDYQLEHNRNRVEAEKQSQSLYELEVMKRRAILQIENQR